VLSVYVNADRRRDPNLQAAAIDLKNRFRELQRRLAEDAGSDQSRELAPALERLWPQVESLASPTASGRGRIAFAALDSDWIVPVESAMPVANRMVFDDGPFVHPLLELLDEGRPAGVVIVSADDARLLEWRLGSLRLVSRVEHEYVEAPHERAGQIGGGPPGQFHTPMREQRQARERDRMHRFLDRVTKAATELAGERGWERILVSGHSRPAPGSVPSRGRPTRDSGPRRASLRYCAGEAPWVAPGDRPSSSSGATSCLPREFASSLDRTQRVRCLRQPSGVRWLADRPRPPTGTRPTSRHGRK
jgi:hypothetical protein